MLAVLGKNLDEHRKIPQLYRMLVSKCAWWCVKHDRNPAEFDKILSEKSPYEMFEAAGKKMGIKLDYEKEQEKIFETEQKMEEAEKVVKKMKNALIPPFTRGTLSARYNTVLTKIGWYCYNNGVDADDAIKELSDYDLHDLESCLYATKFDTAVFVGTSFRMRTNREHRRILDSYIEKMEEQGVPKSLRPLVFDMLASGRSIYTNVREYSEDVVDAAAYIADMERPLEVWHAAEALRHNLLNENGWRPALLEFASKMAREYPNFSGDKISGVRDYFAAAGQFMGLRLEEASRRKFLPNKISLIARHLACSLSDCHSVSPDVVELARNTAQATKNVPSWSLFIELDLFKGKTLREAVDGFDRIMDEALEKRGARMFEGYQKYLRFDPDKTERMFQKKALARAGGELIKSGATLPVGFLSDRKHSLPENFIRDLRSFLAEANRTKQGPVQDLAR